MRFLSLEKETDALRYVDGILEWLLPAAGAPFEFVFGGQAGAEGTLTRWLARPSSELSIRRVHVLVDDGRLVGGYIALGGLELAACQRADAIATVTETDRAGRADIARRLRVVSELRPPVADRAFYLSKLGVAPTFAGRGFGRALATEFLRVGRSAGHTLLQLDVDPENVAAVSLYESLGLRALSASESSDGRFRSCRMELVDEVR